MKRIIRPKLSPAEATKYQVVREQIAEELPELFARHHTRSFMHAITESNLLLSRVYALPRSLVPVVAADHLPDCLVQSIVAAGVEALASKIGEMVAAASPSDSSQALPASVSTTRVAMEEAAYEILFTHSETSLQNDHDEEFFGALLFDYMRRLTDAELQQIVTQRRLPL